MTCGTRLARAQPETATEWFAQGWRSYELATLKTAKIGYVENSEV
jgi:hypothetical protein